MTQAAMNAQPVMVDRNTADPISLGAALVTGKKVAPDATRLLMQDHREAMDFFLWYEEADTADERLKVARKICAALEAHMIVEEEIFYPAMAEAVGDDGLIDRAIAEHGVAKRLIAELKSAMGRGDVPHTVMADLRKTIEEHVREEETELFAMVRGTGLDLYRMGSRMAARKVEAMFELTGRATAESNLREADMNAVSQDEALGLFVVGLRNAHGVARQCKEMVERQVGRLENYPKVKARLQQHLAEKDHQIGRLERILDSLGESRSTMKDILGAMAGNMSAMMNAPADDEILKNSFASFSLANFEIAAYESLLTIGQAAGQQQAVRELQKSLNEEREMAAWLAENVRGVTLMHLQMRSSGQQAKH